MLRYLIILLLSFSVLNCSNLERNSDPKIIKIDITKKENILSRPKKISIESAITIKSDSSSYFGNIKRLKYYKNRIYIYDHINKTLLVFSKNGDFINKTKYGEGPGEVTYPSIFFVDKEHVLLSEITGFINKYDLDLNFISRERYEGVHILDFAKIDNKMLVSTHFNQDFAYTLYSDPLGLNLENQFIKDYKNSDGVQDIGKSISINNNRVLLIAPFDYNVYELIDNNVRKAYHFDFGTYEIQKEEIERGGINQGGWGLVKLGQRVGPLTELSESNNFLSFRIRFINELITYIYSTSSGGLFQLNTYFDKGSLPKCKIRGVLQQDIFYATVEAEDMIEFQEKTGQKLVEGKVKPDQNPFLITFSLTEN